MLTAIATQGAISRETQNGYYVKSYKLEVSTNGEDWMVYRHGKNHKVNPVSYLKGTQKGTSGALSPPHPEERTLFSEAQIIVGGKGHAGSENLLSYAKVIGKHHFSDILAAVASCTGKREEC
jgi:hypothetical protein